MAIFTLPAPNGVNTEQLCAEIEAATGLDVRKSYGVTPPDKIEIGGADGWEAEIQAVIDVHVPALPVPVKVPLYALRYELKRQALFTTVEAAIAAIPDPDDRGLAAEGLEYGNEIERRHPLVLLIQQAIPMTDAEADQLFRDAAALVNPTP